MRLKGGLVFGIACLILTIGFSQGVFAYTIEGKRIYQEDSHAFISASPHTLTDSGWVEFTVVPKDYTGDINLAWLFNTDNAQPTKAEYYSPHTEYKTVNWSYEIEGVRGDTSSINACDVGENGNKYRRAVTYEDEEGQEHTITVCFDTYTLEGDKAVFYYKKTLVSNKDWKDVSGAFQSKTVQVGDKNKAYYKTNFPVEAGETYKLRAWLEVPFNSGGKYDFGVWPSSMTLQEARDGGHLYLLDPWWSTNWSNKITVNITNTLDTTLTDYQVHFQVNTSALNSSGLLRGDCGDLRFLSLAGQQLSHWYSNSTKWCNNISVNTTVYVKIPSLPSGLTQIEMYFNNSQATTAADGWATFKDGVFDDFYGSSLDAGNWTGQAGDISVSGGILTLRGHASTTAAQNPTYVTPPFISHYYLKTSGGNLNSNYFNYARDTENDDKVMPLFETTANQFAFNTLREGATTQTTAIVLSDVTKWYDYVVVTNTTHSLIYQDSTLKATHNTNIPLDPLGYRLYVGTDTNDYSYIDYVFYREWAPVEPTIVLGALESAPVVVDTCTPTPGANWEVNISQNCVLTGEDVTVLDITFNSEDLGGTLWLNYTNLTFSSITIPASGVSIKITSNNLTDYYINEDGIVEDSITTFPGTDMVKLGDYTINTTCGSGVFIGWVDCGTISLRFTKTNITVNGLAADNFDFTIDNTDPICEFDITTTLGNTTAFAYVDGLPYSHSYCASGLCPPGEATYFYYNTTVLNGVFDKRICGLDASNDIQFLLYDIATTETLGSCLTYQGYSYTYTAGAGVDYLALNISSIDQVNTDFTNVYTESVAFNLNDTWLLLDTSINKNAEIYLGSSTATYTYPETSISPDVLLDLSIQNFTLLNNFYKVNMRRQTDGGVWDYSSVGDQSLTILCNQNAPDTLNLTSLNLTTFYLSVKEKPILDFTTNDELHLKYQPYLSSETINIYNLDDNDTTIRLDFNLLDYTGDFKNSHLIIYNRVNNTLQKAWQQKWYALQVLGVDILNNTYYQFVLYTPDETRIIKWQNLMDDDTILISVKTPTYSDEASWHEGIDIGFTSDYDASTVGVAYSINTSTDAGSFVNITFQVYNYSSSQYVLDYQTTISGGGNSGSISYNVKDPEGTYYLVATTYCDGYNNPITIRRTSTLLNITGSVPYYGSFGLPDNMMGLDKADVYTAVSMFLVTTVAMTVNAVSVGTGVVIVVGLIGVLTHLGWSVSMTWAVFLFMFSGAVLYKLSERRRRLD